MSETKEAGLACCRDARLFGVHHFGAVPIDACSVQPFHCGELRRAAREIERLTAERDEARATAEYNANVADVHDKLATKWHAEFLASQATVSTLTRQLEAAEDARTRLSNYADAANAGHAQAGGRELARKIWGAFSDYDALRSLKQGERDGSERYLEWNEEP